MEFHSSFFSVAFTSLLHILTTHLTLQKYGIKVNLIFIITSSGTELPHLESHSWRGREDPVVQNCVAGTHPYDQYGDGPVVYGTSDGCA